MSATEQQDLWGADCTLIPDMLVMQTPVCHTIHQHYTTTHFKTTLSLMIMIIKMV